MAIAVTAAIGMVMLLWTVASVGVAQLTAQLHLFGLILPFAIALAALRFALQAAGWRVVMPEGGRPSLLEATVAVVAGEAAGYLAWGPISREPVKAMMINRHTPQQTSLAAAVVERLAYTGSAAGLIVAALVIAAMRTGHEAWIVDGLAAALMTVAVVFALRPCFPTTSFPPAAARPLKMTLLVALTTAQEITNVIEAFVILRWLGTAPTFEAVIAFEGLSRLANSAGQFIPGKIGISEMAGAGFAGFLRLGSAQGLALTVARRLRSLAWAGVGVALLMVSAARRRGVRPLDGLT